MALTINIPGGAVQLSGNPVIIEAATTRTNVSQQMMLLRIVAADPQLTGTWIEDISGISAQFDISGLVDASFEYQFDIENEFLKSCDPLLLSCNPISFNT